MSRNLPLHLLRTLAACGLLAASVAQAAEGQCILAGRLDADQKWAPRMAGIELLGPDGKRVSASSRDALGAVKQVRVNSTALLAGCDGNQAIANADGQAAFAKAKVPALSAGKAPIEVEAVSFPPLKVAGGELVELRLKVPAERVVMVSR